MVTREIQTDVPLVPAFQRPTDVLKKDVRDIALLDSRMMRKVVQLVNATFQNQIQTLAVNSDVICPVQVDTDWMKRDVQHAAVKELFSLPLNHLSNLQDQKDLQ